MITSDVGNAGERTERKGLFSGKGTKMVKEYPFKAIYLKTFCLIILLN